MPACIICSLCLSLPFLSLAHSGSLWLTLAHSGSLWLAVRLTLALSGSLWLSLAMVLSGSISRFSLALSGSLWLSIALRICLKSPFLSHKILAWLAMSLLSYNTLIGSGAPSSKSSRTSSSSQSPLLNAYDTHCPFEDKDNGVGKDTDKDKMSKRPN